MRSDDHFYDTYQRRLSKMDFGNGAMIHRTSR